MTRRPDMKCSRCGEQMWRNRLSAPADRALCGRCRGVDAQRKKRAQAWDHSPKTCPTCGLTFTPIKVNQTYCGTGCRGTRTKSTTARGYGAEHQALRREWSPHVEAGEVDCHAVKCLMPSRRIEPGTPWDLGHTEDRSDWTGPEHRRCNRTEPQFRDS